MASIRQLLSGKVRSQSGCYTCRLRRKKCDERHPICDACGALEITCYFGDQKPDWMDGGPKQKAMAETIKAQVKKQASQRRDRKYLEMLETGTRDVNLNDNDGSSASPEAKRNGQYPHGAPTPESSNGTANGGAPSPESAWHTYNNHAPPADASGRLKFDGDYDSGQDTHLVMVYLDFVFPFLFPHYNPTVLVGGRGWVLDVLLNGNKSIYYTAISLASYFFGILLANGEAQHASCTARMAHQLQRQMEKSLKELQKDISNINAKKPVFDSREGLVVLQSILQMLIFEVATSNNQNWKMHLDAAIALFVQILPQAENWTETLHKLYTPRWPPPEFGARRPWSTPQASIRFFGANLIFMDLMSSITQCKTPRLQQYQASVLPNNIESKWSWEPQTAAPLRMEEFFGLYNWVVQLVSDIAALASLKNDQVATNSLSMPDIIARGTVLSETIKINIELLQTQWNNIETSKRCLVQDPLASLNPWGKNSQPNFVFPNLVWLHAANIYLHTVMDGWQPDHPNIRGSVDKVTELMYSMPDSKTLQTLAFPYCVAGCMAPVKYEEQYREMVRKLGPLQVIGTIKEAQGIVERMWIRREHTDESWTLSKSLNVQGHSVLLI